MSQEHEPSILLSGPTGAVGTQVLQCLLSDTYYKRIVVLTRRILPHLEQDTRIEQHIVDYDNLEDVASKINTRDIFCGLGTTHKKAGSKARFFQIDHDYPLKLAQIAQKNKVNRFILVSSVGADPKAWGHYLKTKGLLEQALQELSFESLILLRPSMLLGPREEHRPGEEWGKKADKALGWLLPKRYRGIHTRTIAQRVLDVGHQELTGFHVFESEQIAI